jgi:hypothetical protein
MFRKFFVECSNSPRVLNWRSCYSTTTETYFDGLLQTLRPATRAYSSPIYTVAHHISTRPYSSSPTPNCIAMSQPVARDFQTSRASTQVIEPPSRVSADLEAGHHRRRHHTLSPESFKSSRGRSPRVSFDGGPSPNKRITRQDTVRNYHSPTRTTWEEPGAEPGIDTNQDEDPRFGHLFEHCQITVVDFSDDKIEKHELDNKQLIEFLNEPKPEWMSCRWVNVNGLSWDVIKALGNANNLHRLAIEDLMNTRGRTKADWYADHAFSKYPCLLLSILQYHFSSLLRSFS